jgi:hypothetical protein
MKAKWSTEAVEYIKDNYTTMTDRVMSCVLGVSQEAIKKKRMRLGLAKAIKPDAPKSKFNEVLSGDVRGASKKLVKYLISIEASLLDEQYDIKIVSKTYKEFKKIIGFENTTNVDKSVMYAAKSWCTYLSSILPYINIAIHNDPKVDKVNILIIKDSVEFSEAVQVLKEHNINSNSVLSQMLYI